MTAPHQTLSWDYPHISSARPLGPGHSDLVVESRDVLDRHGAFYRFDISLLHTHFPLRPDEVILEDTDVNSRIQTMQPVSISELDNVPLTETSRTLETGQPMMRCTCLTSGMDYIHRETD